MAEKQNPVHEVRDFAKAGQLVLVLFEHKAQL